VKVNFVMNQDVKQFIKKLPAAHWLYRSVHLIPAMLWFMNDLKRFFRLSRKADSRIDQPAWGLQPSLRDRTVTTDFDRHYIYHPAWAARIVAEINPDIHVDISSSLVFCSMVSAFVPVVFYDYRPADLQLGNLQAKSADLMSLPFADDIVRSLSCMHVVEHVGLGRYGDPLDPDGDQKAVAELNRVLAPGGDLLFVVPVGRPRIMFNSHRIYSYEQVLAFFSELTLAEFALVPDGSVLTRNALPELVNKQEYGCGCFWFKKPER
jgi:SAM-dependent methyltransferase